MRPNLITGAAAAFALFIAVSAAAEESDFVAVSLGGFDVNDDDTAIEGRIEYRSKLKLYVLQPMIGIMVNDDGGLYGYGGVFVDFEIGERWTIMPNFAAGAYRQGGSKDLGSVIEFRSGVEIAYRFDGGARLGVAFQHISNASIDDRNPGAESLVLTYAVPFELTF